MPKDNFSDNGFEQCMKCTICTAYCPVSMVNPLFPGPKQAGPDGERLRRKDPSYYDQALKYCLNCKLCEIACPSDVRIGDIILSARLKHGKGGVPLRDKLLASTDLAGKLASPISPAVNQALRSKPVKAVMDKLLKIDGRREFPRYSAQTFEKWFKDSAQGEQAKYRKKVTFFHGCYVNYNYPRLGMDLVKVLNAAGYGVRLLDKETCCGVAMISNGMARQALKHARTNMDSIRKTLQREGCSLIGTSSTCIFTLREEYPNLLGVENEDLRDRIDLATRFLCRERDEGRIKFKFRQGLKMKIAYHLPCHLEKMGWGRYSISLLREIPGVELILLDRNCCGIAGTYGFKKENYQVSQMIGAPLFRQIKEVGADCVATDCETCRWQIEMSAGAQVKHPITILAETLDLEETWKSNNNS